MSRRKYIDNLARDKRQKKVSLSYVPKALSKVSGIDAFISPARTYNLKPEKSSIIMPLNIF